MSMLADLFYSLAVIIVIYALTALVLLVFMIFFLLCRVPLESEDLERQHLVAGHASGSENCALMWGGSAGEQVTGVWVMKSAMEEAEYRAVTWADGLFDSSESEGSESEISWEGMAFRSASVSDS